MKTKKLISLFSTILLLSGLAFIFSSGKALAYVDCSNTHYVRMDGRYSASSNVSSEVDFYALRDTHTNDYCGVVYTLHASEQIANICGSQWAFSNNWWSNNGTFGCGAGLFKSLNSPARSVTDGSYVDGITSTCYNGTCVQASENWHVY